MRIFYFVVCVQLQGQVQAARGGGDGPPGRVRPVQRLPERHADVGYRLLEAPAAGVPVQVGLGFYCTKERERERNVLFNDALNAFYLRLYGVRHMVKDHSDSEKGERERNVLFNDALNTFYLRLYGVRHMVKDHSDSEKGNPLPPHRLHLSINSKGSFICTIPQTG